jgi:fimbrial chaperone protein
VKYHLSPLLLLASLSGGVLPNSAAIAQEQPQQARLNVTPLRLELPAGQAATQMLVRNQGEKQIAVQMRVFEWTQDGGENHYAPSRDVAVSPSIVKIEPGLAQSFHILSRGTPATSGERRFRVVLDEIPDSEPAAPGTARTRLRLTLPLFIGSNTAQAGRLQVAAQPGVLILANGGGRTIRLSDLQVTADGNPVPIDNYSMLQYIHGASWIAIPLPDGVACSGEVLRLSATADGGSFDEIASQDCP